MTRTDFTPVHETIASFCNTMAAFKRDLFETANEQRKDLLALYRAMAGTQADIEEFGALMGEMSTVLSGIEHECESISGKIEAAIGDGYDAVPECSYEVYVDTCEICGLDVTAEQEYTEGEFGYVHTHCLAAEGEAQVADENEDVFEKDELPVT